MMRINLTFRVWILIISLVIAIMAINPLLALEKGVIVKNIEQDSIFFREGMGVGEIIKEIDGNKISSVADYSNIMNQFSFNPAQFFVSTDSGLFTYFSDSLGFDVYQMKGGHKEFRRYVLRNLENYKFLKNTKIL